MAEKGDEGPRMKLELRGHDERYVVEQSLLNLFPGERPVYEPITGEDDTWAAVSLEEDGNQCRVTAELRWHGTPGQCTETAELSGTEYRREGLRRRLIGRCFYRAARDAAGVRPPWGMLSGVRPDKPVTRALLEGRTEAEALELLEQTYFVTPDRAALALETGRTAYQAARTLEERDIAVYVGIPFCPTRCAYCSFVSQSVEKSFPLVEPYVDALVREIRDGGALAERLGLRARSFYMGGGTPTTLSPEQLDRVLTAFREAFGPAGESTVEAGRPDTITAEKLAVLRAHGITRISVNPQSMEDRVLEAIGRRHTAADVERAMELAAGFPHVNMDLIAGLPEDTPEGFARTLERCLGFRPDNLTVHTLALKKGSRILTEGAVIPDAAAVGIMLDNAGAVLRGAGFVPYYLYRQKYMSGSFENTGWCLPGTACLYNIFIMSELCTILSFGAGGSTKLVSRDGRRIRRVWNPRYPAEYLERAGNMESHWAAVAAFYGYDEIGR